MIELDDDSDTIDLDAIKSALVNISDNSSSDEKAAVNRSTNNVKAADLNRA